MSILEVNDVSIRYLTGDFKDIGIKEYVMRKLTDNYRVNEFWADRHVSFTLEKGDMLGIIGANGAGKSTLLKAVSGIMEPTEGSVRREGTVAALLELGSGFDGDLTVRENTYLRGAMLGYTREFMDEMYDSIIGFAELEAFQDQPFKQLSSGMQSRLAFSIASLVNPDILILDEVLSVGDGAFRKKSEDKMREIIGGGATTILVTHSIDQVREMCNKVLWLHKGEQVAYGENVEEICGRYEEFLNGRFDVNTLLGKEDEPEGGTAAAVDDTEDQKTVKESNDMDETTKANEPQQDKGTNRKGNALRRHNISLLEIFLSCFLICLIAYVGYLTFTKLNPYGLNSDASNEISFRRYTWEHKTLFPKEFVAGHELLINRPVLLWWLFYAISHNFLLSYELEIFSVILLQMGAFWYLLSKLKLERRIRLLIMCMYFCVWPVGYNFCMHSFFDIYSVFAVVTMLTLGLRISVREKVCAVGGPANLKAIALPVCLLAVISGVMGFTSVRLLMSLYVPLIAVDGLLIIFHYINGNKLPKRALVLAALDLMCLVVNVLAQGAMLILMADSFNPQGITIVDINSLLDWNVLRSQLASVLTSIGITGSGPIQSIGGINFALRCCFALLAVTAVIWLLRHNDTQSEGFEDAKDMALYFISTTLVMFLLGICTGGGAIPERYYWASALSILFVCGAAMDQWTRKRQGKDRGLICAVVTMGVIALFGVNVKQDIARYSAPPPVLTQVAKYIEENGYKYVTASYWNAGVIEGYTNGAVGYQHDISVNGDLVKRAWAIDTGKFEQPNVGVPNILLLTDEEEAAALANQKTGRLIAKYGEKVQEIDVYNLYAFNENPYTLLDKIDSEGIAGLPQEGIHEKTDVFSNDGFIFVNAELNNFGELVTNGSAGGGFYGPYSPSVAGIYDITLVYSVDACADRSAGVFDVALDAEQIAVAEFDASHDSVTLYGVAIDAGKRFEARAAVPEGMIVRLQSIVYKRTA